MLIVIQTINNFTMHRLFNLYIRVLLDSFCYYTINNMEKLIDQESEKNINLITFPILIAICIYIGPTKFLKNKTPNIKFITDDTTCKK